MLRKPHLMEHLILLPCYLACFGWVHTATPNFRLGFTLRKVWEEPEGKGVSAAWNGAWDHVKELDGDSVGSCPLQQERRNHRKEVFWKKISYCNLGWIFVLGRGGAGDRDDFPSLAKIFFCLIRGKTTFASIFLSQKIHSICLSGVERKGC